MREKAFKKADIVKAVAGPLGLSERAVSEVVDAIFHEVIGALASGKRVYLSGIGSLESRPNQARKYVNPALSQPVVQVPACNRVGFRASKVLKREVNK